MSGRETKGDAYSRDDKAPRLFLRLQRLPSSPSLTTSSTSPCCGWPATGYTKQSFHLNSAAESAKMGIVEKVSRGAFLQSVYGRDVDPCW